MHRSPAGLDLAAQELVVLARLALALNELAHQFAQHLRRRAMGGLGLGHELGAQLGLMIVHLGAAASARGRPAAWSRIRFCATR